MKIVYRFMVDMCQPQTINIYCILHFSVRDHESVGVGREIDELLLEESIYEVNFGYDDKMEGYAKSSSDMSELGEICGEENGRDKV